MDNDKKKYLPKAILAKDLPEDIIEQIRNTRMDSKYDYLNDELDKVELENLLNSIELSDEDREWLNMKLVGKEKEGWKDE